jgi:hypothetical protein
VAVNNFRVMSLAGAPSDAVGGRWTFRSNVRKARIQTQFVLLSDSESIRDYRPCVAKLMHLMVAVEPTQGGRILSEELAGPQRFYVAIAK